MNLNMLGMVTYIDATTNTNTVVWATTAIENGLAAVGDTYHLYLRDDSTIAGSIIPSAFSTNILHIDTAAGTTVTQLVENINYLYVNMGAQLTTIWPDPFVTNSTLAFPAPWRRKLPALVVASALLFGMNVVRIVSLYLLGSDKSSMLETIHLLCWPAFFIICSLALWVLWLRWIQRPIPAFESAVQARPVPPKPRAPLRAKDA
jgi:exosortase/archaeosortase family protein